MRRPPFLLALLLVLGQLALALHQIEHRLEPLGHDQGQCGICAVADHLGTAPFPPVVVPSGLWVELAFRPLSPPLLAASRPAELRARAPPISLA